MELSKNFKLAEQIKYNQGVKERYLSGIQYIEFTLQFMFATTFLLYWIFAFTFYVTDVFGLAAWLTKHTGEGLAFIIYLAMSFLMAVSLSMFKHAFYQHKAEFNYALGITIAIATLGVAMEIFNSTSQQQHIAFSSAEKSSTYSALADTTITINGSVNGELAQAEKKLAQCKANLGKPGYKHCDGDLSYVNSLKQQQDANLKATTQATETAIKAKETALSNTREDYQKPVFKMIRDIFGITIATAMVLVAGFFTSGFEFSHALLSRMLKDRLQELQKIEMYLIELQGQYMDGTNKRYSPDDFADKRKIDLSDKPLKDSAPDAVSTPSADGQYQKTSIGFTAPLPQSKAEETPVLFKWQAHARSGSALPRVDSPTIRQALRGGVPLYPTRPLDSQVVENTDNTRLNVQAREPNVQAREPNVQTREPNVQTREPNVQTREPSYTSFKEIPTYGSGCCKWCGADIASLRRGSKFCSNDHKNKWWNLYKPSNKRSVRS